MKDDLLKVNPIVGQRIKQLREQKHMTQHKLAELLGYRSKTSVSHMENGREIPRPAIAKLARIFGVSPAYLMGWEDDPLPKDVSAFKLKTDTKEGQKKAKEALEKGFAQLSSPPKASAPKETVQDRLKKEAESMTNAELVECLGIIQKELEKKSQGSGA